MMQAHTKFLEGKCHKLIQNQNAMTYQNFFSSQIETYFGYQPHLKTLVNYSQSSFLRSVSSLTSQVWLNETWAYSSKMKGTSLLGWCHVLMNFTNLTFLIFALNMYNKQFNKGKMVPVLLHDQSCGKNRHLLKCGELDECTPLLRYYT